jgi:menaquinone-dependent protoporphyrinogen IX oxidase
VAHATKKGATVEVAAALGEEWSLVDVDSDVRLVREVRDLRSHGTLALGSAACFGKWRKEALAFGSRHAGERPERPVGLLEGGPTDASADQGEERAPQRRPRLTGFERRGA